MYAFGFVFLIVAGTIAWFMPKTLTRKEIYVTWVLMAAMNINLDVVFGEILDLFDVAAPRIQLLDLLFEATLGALMGIIFLNFMPQKFSNFVKYLTFAVIISVFVEYLSVKFDFIQYKGWNLWYSAIVYLAGMFVLRWHLFFLRSGEDRK